MLKFSFNLTANSKTLTLSGLAGLALLIGIFSIPNLLAPQLDSERAEKETRSYFKRQAATWFTAELKRMSSRAPTKEMAQRLKQELKQIEELEFVSVQVKHFLVAPPGSASRIFVAKAVFRDIISKEKTRYFSLTSRSRLFDFFWVSEQSRLMWIFSF